MKVKYKESIEYKMIERINQLSSQVVLREDMADLGSYRQVSRALNKLIKKKQLIKVGFGIYAKAQASQYGDKALLQAPLSRVATEALNRLGVQWELGQALQDYNAGRSQQVPAKFIVRLKSRFRRTIGNSRRQVIFEGGINAR